MQFDEIFQNDVGIPFDGNRQLKQNKRKYKK